MEYYDEMNEQTKRGHGTLALIIGIAGLLITLFVGGTFGVFGIVSGTILSVLAIVLGILSIRATRACSGKGGVIIGFIAILFSILISGMVFALGSFLRSDEVRESIPTLSAYSDESWRGVIGLFLKMSSDGVEPEALQKEIDAYNQKYGVPAVETGQTGCE